MSHSPARRALSRTRLIGAGVLSVMLMASPLSVTSASAADVSLNVLLDGISLNVSQRATLDKQYRHYRQHRKAAESRHDAKALAKARAAYLADVDRILNRHQTQRFHQQFNRHYPANAKVAKKSHHSG
ncbi:MULTISPECIES: hypothetical protein [unclassified Cobetia]|uniref:hypothetical protein n=1 Tax=unclassified Cobetia TaxID=2609414 RepID=UPI002096BC38|nr:MULTISPECIES: hypothetical protein [unclassified Cobetia]MCO7234011.1 hypothetical protein [Cobetia sp. Dlab-2-AX]MCO7237251.1 hypothetical protein [Cobetia sp. Dlab-2-U]